MPVLLLGNQHHCLSIWSHANPPSLHSSNESRYFLLWNCISTHCPVGFTRSFIEVRYPCVARGVDPCQHEKSLCKIHSVIWGSHRSKSLYLNQSKSPILRDRASALVGRKGSFWTHGIQRCDESIISDLIIQFQLLILHFRPERRHRIWESSPQPTNLNPPLPVRYILGLWNQEISLVQNLVQHHCS